MPGPIWLAPSAYHPTLGGIQEMTAQLARRLQQRGHRVQVLTNRWPAGTAAREMVGGVEVLRLDMPAPGLRPTRLPSYRAAAGATARSLDRIAAEFRPELIHVVGASWHATHVARLAARRDLPLVLTLQGETAMDDTRLYERGVRSLLVRSALKRVAAQAAAVTACSRWALDHAAAIAPALATGEVVPNGVDVAALAGTGPVPASGPILAYGRLVPNKGFDLLIAAMAQLPELQLRLGGNGPEEEHLRSAAEAVGNVELIGRLDRAGVARELAACRLVVMPSRLEPFGMVALEAMAAGRPVVASSVGGAGEFVQGGVLVDPTDTPALVEAIRESLRHPERGEQGRVAARELDWEFITARYADIFSRVQRGA